MSAYYNDNDPFVAAWLRELIKRNLIAQGEVDERSIADVKPSDLNGFTQCHFFAGIGGWPYALRLAGWPDDRPCWTGSCPCQPFSAAGQGKGHADERHLWSAWFHLIGECRPSVIFGEQVEAAIKHGWLDLVSDDLEGIGYAVGAHGVAAANIGAPHQRKRIWFVADSQRASTESWRSTIQSPESNGAEGTRASTESGRCSDAGGVDHSPIPRRASPGERDGGSPLLAARSEQSGGTGIMALSDGRHSVPEGLQRSGEQRQQPEDGGTGVELGDSNSEGPQGRSVSGATGERNGPSECPSRPPSASFWSSCDWLPCIDGRSRPVEPGTFPLAHGIPARVGRLRGYGNAIVPQVAEAFIESYMEATDRAE